MLNFVLCPLLCGLVAQAQLAGNEDYALDARKALKKSLKRRDTPAITFEPTSTSFTLGNKTYISPTSSQFKQYALDTDWGLDSYRGQILPITVFDVQGEVTCDILGKQVEDYATDDVWDQAFMSAVLFSTTSSFHIADVSACLGKWGGNLIIKSGNATSSVKTNVAHVSADQIPPGPYLANVGEKLTLTEVYRTYRDEAQAFTTPAIQSSSGYFYDLTTPVLGLGTLSIPVPSRLYTKYLSNPRPLEGRRIAVKDLFDMAGLKTGGGNRAYFNTYPVKETTAVAIQKLIDQGGIIVGRVKTSQFANGESATADWVDQMCPFNPRGDGYQQPSSSSSGPGAAQAAYDWLDHTIGSDTGGSIIDPATVGGTYGLRPTWNAISLKGAIPMQATQDTAGFFSRNAREGAAFARGWYGDNLKEHSSFPKNLILPNSSWTFESDYAGADQFEKFKSGLLKVLQPESVDGNDFDTLWNSTGYYNQVGNLTAGDYLNETYANLISYYQWNNLGKMFYEDYAEQNEGRVPFIDPSPLVRWTYGRDNMTTASFNASLATKATWKEFIDTRVLIADNVTCSNTLYVYPYGLGVTDYRNAYRSPPTVPWGFYYPAQFSGVPQLIIPIGQIAYESTITNHTEYLPLSVTLFAANGCDYLLWDVAAALEEAQVTESVAAGKLAFPNRV